jgi:SAM-dependent methyltransferase
MGAELDDGVVKDCQARLGNDSRVSFVRTADLSQDQYTDAFDGLVCMEVLEHVVDRRPLYQHWRWLVKPGGTIVISVPVETGPALAVKQIVRRVAGWRGIGDYPGLAPYTWGEFFRTLVARNRQPIQRPIHSFPSGTVGHCHKGFNWRVLREELAEHFHMERTLGSPLTWLPPGLGSQVWFVFRNPPRN